MKKKKRIRRLLSSFVCLIGSAIGLTTGLSSCVSSSNDDENGSDSDDSVITPPSNGDNNSDDNNNNNDNNNGNNGVDGEGPIEPESKPEVKPPIDNTPNEPNLPENKPEPTPPTSNLISNDSISLKDKGQLLPSQYLTNISDLNNIGINKEKIAENFDKNKVTEPKYSLISLNDEYGTLSIKMEYKDDSNKTNEFIFNFTGLANFKNQSFSLFFNVENKSLLNAKEISDKKINNDSEAKVFFNYLKQNETNLVFKNGLKELPLEYLNFEDGISFSGFQQSWYTLNNDLNLNIQPKTLKINAYVKQNSSNKITIKSINYPTNLVGSNKKPIKLICSSALDYLLEKITANDDYKEDKFASYYYYDIVYDNCTQTQLKLSNDNWLKNVSNSIEGYNAKQYRPVISKAISPSIDNNGNLTIQIQMQLSDDNVYSINSKELVIKSFLSTKENLFYNSGSKDNKFNLFCEGNNQDEIFNYISKHKKILEIKKYINDSKDLVVNVSKYFNVIDHIKFKNYIKLYFGSSEMIKNTTSHYFTSDDNKISIQHYDIDLSNVMIIYDKNTNCFKLQCRLIISCEGIDYESSESDDMIVNITKINKPLS